MKAERHDRILKLIESGKVERQEQLRELLAGEGINVTQATLSRDIRELGLKKADIDGVSVYIMSEKFTDKLPMIFIDSVIGVDSAGNTVVIKCRSGMAQAACATFDKGNYAGVVGTIAGDDTIFVLMRTEKDARLLVSDMRRLFSKG